MNKMILFLKYYFKTRYRKKFNTREELEQWQNEEVIKFLSKTIPKSPFYQELHQGFTYRDWKEYPIIDKKIMMDNFDRLNTKKIRKEDAFRVALKAEESRDFSPTINGITIGLSSGTSGSRGLFLVSEEERVMWAGTILAKLLPGSLLSKQKIAFFLRANSNLYNTLNAGKISFKFFDLLDTLESHVQELNDFQPTIIVAPPSMLRYLATKQGHKELRIQPTKILSVAEVLDLLDETYIAEQFNQKVHQVYQCTEGFLATTCEHGTLHLNEDLLVIQKEYLDKGLGKFSPIITDFSRTAQPIIRYRLNDILTEKKEKCSCGSVFTAIESIEGRCDDLFYFPSYMDGKHTTVFPDFMRRSIIAASTEIEEYIVKQTQLNEMEVSLQLKNSATRNQVEENVEMEIKKLCHRLNCHAPKMNFTVYNHKPSDKKLRRIERLCKIDDHSII